MRTIRLLHLIKTFDIGGVERSTITYSNQLITFVGTIAIFAQKGKLDHSNIIHKNVSMFYSFGNISNPFTTFFNLLKIIRVIVTKKINVVNYHQRIYIPFIAIIKILFPGLKIIYTHHNVFNDVLNKLIIADLKIAISKSTKEDLQKFLISNIIVLKHGLEIISHKNKNDRKFKNIGYVGRFTKVKGIFVLLEAFRDLSSINKNINLILVGEGKEQKGIIKYITQNHLETRVFIKEPTFLLSKIYEDLDCVVLPSEKHEGFGLVLAEAMSFGIPVIASDLETFKEIVMHETTGLIFKVGDVDSLKEQLMRIIDDKFIREKIIDNSIKLIETNYDIRNHIKEYLVTVNTLINF